MKESLLMKTKTVAETMNCLKTVSVILVRQPEFPRSHNLKSNNRLTNERKLHLTHLLYVYYNHFKNDPRSVVLIIKQQNSETA